jgi:hypothetical protein
MLFRIWILGVALILTKDFWSFLGVPNWALIGVFLFLAALFQTGVITEFMEARQESDRDEDSSRAESTSTKKPVWKAFRRKSPKRLKHAVPGRRSAKAASTSTPGETLDPS